MPTEIPSPKRGLVIDGIVASEAIDSSGEILDVKGCDISSMEVDGLLNYEHRGDSDPTASFDDIVGRCIQCKKIFGASDCKTDRERAYWDSVKLPFIYGQFRLFDEADHENAKAAAAIIRDQHAAGEKLILRFSIEGSTIEREGQTLKRTIARRCALTAKPANKSAITGLFYDPKAPETKAAQEKEDPLAFLKEDAKKFEHPGFERLGSGVPFVYVPFNNPVSQVQEALLALRKTYTAGTTDVAPGSLMGTEALQREDESLRRSYLQAAVKSAIRDYDESRHGEFRPYLKSMLPEVSDEFLDIFDDVVDEIGLKGAKKQFLGKKEEGKPSKAKKSKKKEEDVDPNEVPTDAEGYAREIDQIKAGTHPRNAAMPPVEGMGDPGANEASYNSFIFDGARGVFFLNAKGKLRAHRLYAPTDEEFAQILADNPRIQQVHDRAMDNWVLVHRLLRSGHLPDDIIAHSALNSAMSPNTAVHIQELAYSFLKDMISRGFDPTKPYSDEEFAKWEREFRSLLGNEGERDSEGFQTGHVLPEFGRDHWSLLDSDIWTKPNKDDLEGKRYSDPKATVRADVGLPTQKWEGVRNYHELHGLLSGLVHQHGIDGAMISNALNAVIADNNRLKNRNRIRAKGGKDVESEPLGLHGFAPKTLRYTLGMLGAGNVVVPDTHFLRHVFGLMPGDPRIDQVKAGFLKSHHEPRLQELDRWYRANHPAFRYARQRLQERYGEDFGDQATFPGFWAHWLSIGPHERQRNWVVSANNEAADHDVIWNSIHHILRQHNIPVDQLLATLRKDEESERDDDEGDDQPSMAMRTASAFSDIEKRFGAGAAQIAYWAFMVPQLLRRGMPQSLKKAETLAATIQSLLKAEDGVRIFRGNAVKPGVVEAIVGPQRGKRLPLVGMSGDKHFVGTTDGSRVYSVNAKDWRVVSKPSVLRRHMVVDAGSHSVLGLTTSDEQRDLMHGVNFSKRLGGADNGGGISEMGDDPAAGFYESSSGLRGYVKPAGPTMRMFYHLYAGPAAQGFTPAHREAAFYSLAKNFFNLGDYVPTTAVFNHPLSGEPHSIQKEVDDGEHYTAPSKNMDATLAGMYESGMLDKLAMMDMILGNGDRHLHNYMWSPHYPNIHLIDNGLSFAPGGRDPMLFLPNIPHYWRRGAYVVNGYDSPGSFDDAFDPIAGNWLRKLDPRKLDDEMAKMGIHPIYRNEALRRLAAAQRRYALGGASKLQMFLAPFTSRHLRPFASADDTDEMNGG